MEMQVCFLYQTNRLNSQCILKNRTESHVFNAVEKSFKRFCRQKLFLKPQRSCVIHQYLKPPKQPPTLPQTNKQKKTKIQNFLWFLKYSWNLKNPNYLLEGIKKKKASVKRQIELQLFQGQRKKPSFHSCPQRNLCKTCVV